MFKKFICILLLGNFFNNQLKAQVQDTVASKTYNVGIFAPLYLDSVFNGHNYRYSKNFPRFILQGLDFVQGAQIALDSLPIKDANLHANIFDSKSSTEDIASLILEKIRQPSFDHRLS